MQEAKEKEEVDLVIVTGMSGAGKTQACRFLEDLGYFVVDNLPPVFILKFAELCRHAGEHIDKVVLVVDTRSREFFDAFIGALDELDRLQVPYRMLYMEADDAAIVRRYKETRRRHPLAPQSRISEGIAKERSRLESAYQRATYVIDTSRLKKVELRDRIRRLFASESKDTMRINVLSFGFKYGMPLDADMVMDVRFLPNPFYIEELKKKSGAVPEVGEYIEKWPVTQEYLTKLDALVDFLVPQCVKEGKAQFVIAIGCTGGMHRSVFVANHLYKRLAARAYDVEIEHRDLFKNDVEEHVEVRG